MKKPKLIVAGTRTITDYKTVADEINEMTKGVKNWQLVTGGARGVDACGEQYAKRHGIEVLKYEANWRKNGAAAGPIRNRIMADVADAALIIWDGESRGAANMIREAKKAGLNPIKVVII